MISHYVHLVVYYCLDFQNKTTILEFEYSRTYLHTLLSVSNNYELNTLCKR